MRSLLTCFALAGTILPVSNEQASAAPSAEELARKAQDPLADVRAVMTDNTIAFGTSDDDTSYGFQIQPVSACQPVMQTSSPGR